MATQTKKARSEAAKKSARTRAQNQRNQGRKSETLTDSEKRSKIAQATALTTHKRMEEANAQRKRKPPANKSFTLSGAFGEGEEVRVYEERQVVTGGKCQGQPVSSGKASKLGEVSLSGLRKDGSYVAVGDFSRVAFTAKD